MGYHIILKHEESRIEHYYVERLNELANYPLSKTSIVYQGEKDWNPEILGHSKLYSSFAHDWHRAGIKAQELFKKQALEEEYILEELSQDSDSFKAYTNVKEEYLQIKRGDFLIRNVKNIEVDVKCRTFYTPKGKEYNCFDFNEEHLVRHFNMYEFTKTPIVIAVYQRELNTDNPITNSLRMIEIFHMKKVIKELGLKKIKRRNSNNEYYSVYQIPINRTMEKFSLIEHLKENISLLDEG